VTPGAAPDTATVVFLGGAAEANTYSGKTGNSLTGLVDAAPPGPAGAHAVGESVIQFGWQIDTGTLSYVPNAGFLGEDSVVTAYSLVAANRTVSITVISDKPVANDVAGSVAATLPVALPTILNFSGSDSSAFGAGSTLQFTTLPTKGLLTSTTPPLTCTDVTGAVIGEVMTNCSASTVYTPLLGATGVDTFMYTITNAGDTSAAATVTVTIGGGGGVTPTPGDNFDQPIVPGLTATVYSGGSVDQLAADAAAAGATSVSVTVSGQIITYVVGAPAFVNQAFVDNFTDGVIPTTQIVLVVVTS
jgi:hypothetical protein